MHPTHRLHSFLACCSFLASPAFALEAPDDNSPPPTELRKMGKGEPLPEIKLPAIKAPKPNPPTQDSQSAFLGVISSEVPEVLAEHLNLRPNSGIIVRSLVPNGPAANAGIHVNDIILKAGDTSIGSPLDFSNQISTKKPGDSLALDMIQKGKPAQIQVTLGAKPAGMATATPQALGPLELNGLPKDLADRIRGAIAGNLGNLDLATQQAGFPPNLEQAVRDLKMQMLGGQDAPAPNAAGSGTHTQGSATIKMKDQLGSVEIKATEGGKEVTIRDLNDQITWTGPWDTAQDQAAAPANVRNRVDSLNLDTSFKGNGIRLRPLQAPAPENGH
jgi:hypothetical protein